MKPVYDALVVGGGFYGLYVAEFLARTGQDVLLCEKRDGLMERASYVNQARVHHGYHYPRSILTAFRSRVNFPRFCGEFPECIDRSFEKLYAIARDFSSVSATQFRLFVERIGAPIEPAPADARALFDPDHVEEVFLVTEHAFDAHKLRDVMLRRVRDAGVEVRIGNGIARVAAAPNDAIDLELDSAAGAGKTMRARGVFLCTYSQTNQILAASALPLVSLKHELTEMCLVEPPAALRARGVTVMCGPFFSCMPFPPRGLHTLSHVRYTPRFHWFDGDGPYRSADDILAQCPRDSAFRSMLRDARRYLPALADCRYRDSLWEVKTILPRNEIDDGRPILLRRHHGLRNLHVILGGKIDNVYDVVDSLKDLT